MNILVTGASGLVGSAFVRAAVRRGHDLVGLVGRYAGPIEGLAAERQIDLRDEQAISGAVLDVFPQAIVNCAAISAPEQCEADPALAQALNVSLPAALARLAHHVSAKLIHLSSEQVFDGNRTTLYSAADSVSPINLYGRQKLASERAVHSAAADFAITLRPPLLLGNSLTGQRSTHERLLADWAAGRAPSLFTDEFRQPCTADNLAEVMVELCERDDLRGIFHWAGAELVSRHALGLRIREHFKLTGKSAPIVAVRRVDAPDAARKRQPCLALDVAPLAGKLKTRPQTIGAQLEELNLPVPVRTWYFGLAQSAE